MNIQYKTKKAFTLAEVLLTLLIIGIVASLVIPAVINDTNEAEYNVGVKKAQSELSNALRMVLINNGGSINVGSGNTLSAHMALTNEFCNVMACVQIDTTSNIFGPTNYKYYKGSGYSSFPGLNDTSPAVILNNGYFISFKSYENCNRSGINDCGYILIDINGEKGPTMIGKDFYYFWIKLINGHYSILPMGIDGDGRTCQADTDRGEECSGCTAKRLIDPAHMP